MNNNYMIEALDAVTWYNGLAPFVFAWKDIPAGEYSKHVLPPEGYGCNDDEDARGQLQVIWIIAVMLFGDYGVSPRFGWIEKIDEFHQWILDITKTWQEYEENEKEENVPYV